MAASAGELRRRRRPAGDDPEPRAPPAAALRPGSFWLTRLLLLRATASVYLIAFLVAYHQNKVLIGDRGLLPCKLYLENVKHHFKGRINMETLSYAPTLIWFLDWSNMDSILDAFALVGLAISAFVLVTGCTNMILMAVVWIIYLSLINVGQLWYSFGWESQLLETGFLAIFLCPLWTLSQLAKDSPPSFIVVWAHRWLIFRVMLGAGMTRVRGDGGWRGLAGVEHHYETPGAWPPPPALGLQGSPGVRREDRVCGQRAEYTIPTP